jgi:hypothetical protein
MLAALPWGRVQDLGTGHSKVSLPLPGTSLTYVRISLDLASSYYDCHQFHPPDDLSLDLLLGITDNQAPLS